MEYHPCATAIGLTGDNEKNKKEYCKLNIKRVSKLYFQNFFKKKMKKHIQEETKAQVKVNINIPLTTKVLPE